MRQAHAGKVATDQTHPSCDEEPDIWELFPGILKGRVFLLKHYADHLLMLNVRSLRVSDQCAIKTGRSVCSTIARVVPPKTVCIILAWP